MGAAESIEKVQTVMRNGVLALAAWLPLPAMALDVEAISRGLVEAGPWGKNAEMLPYLLGWLGFIEMMLFLVVLGVTLVYAWRKGALEWDN